MRDKGYSLENNLRYLQTPVLGRTNIVNGLLCMCMYVGEVCTMCLLYLKSIVRSVVLSIVCSASKAQHASSTVASSCTLQPKLPLCRGCIKKVNLTTSYPRHTHANKECLDTFPRHADSFVVYKIVYVTKLNQRDVLYTARNNLSNRLQQGVPVS